MYKEIFIGILICFIFVVFLWLYGRIIEKAKNLKGKRIVDASPAIFLLLICLFIFLKIILLL